VVGLTLDAEPPGGYSAYPWYALRCNYADSVAGAGGVPVALPHHADLAESYLSLIDALIVTGGAFDVDPALYGDGVAHGTVVLRPGRTAAEHALLRGALARDMPILGICGGEQLLAVALGGTLIQHIPDAMPDALEHEQARGWARDCHTAGDPAGAHRRYFIHGGEQRAPSGRARSRARHPCQRDSA
jgi:putative glutamine amidotransferase